MPTFSLAALIRALLVWLVIIAAESVHGVIRSLLLSPEVEIAIRQLSVLVGVVMIFAITWVLLDWIRIQTARGALATGVVWVALTVAFEVALGWLTGAPWDQIAADYDVRNGGLLPLGLLAMGLTPWAVRQLKAGRPARGNPPKSQRSAS